MYQQPVRGQDWAGIAADSISDSFIKIFLNCMGSCADTISVSSTVQQRQAGIQGVSLQSVPDGAALM